jgi:hypothetical protein
MELRKNQTNFQDYEKVHKNLYRAPQGTSKYYRLFAHGLTPNRCWLVAPVLRHLVDIDTATGKDVFGDTEITFDYVGTVPSWNAYIKI